MFETPRVNRWTYSGTSQKIWAKSINHRLGCIRIKNWCQIICNFCSQGLTVYWHHVSHNTISLPVVILFYYPVATLTCFCWIGLLHRLIFDRFVSSKCWFSICCANMDGSIVGKPCIACTQTDRRQEQAQTMQHEFIEWLIEEENEGWDSTESCSLSQNNFVLSSVSRFYGMCCGAGLFLFHIS